MTNLAGFCKALQPGDLKEGDDGEHDGSQCIDGQPVLLHHIHFIDSAIRTADSLKLESFFLFRHHIQMISRDDAVLEADSAASNSILHGILSSTEHYCLY